MVHRDNNPNVGTVMQFAVSPALNMVWSYHIEGPIKITTMKVDGTCVAVSKQLLMRYARDAMKQQKAGAKHEFIAVTHTVKTRATSKKDDPPVTLKDILTPDPEAPKAVVDPITEADKEVLLTMFEMVSLKLKELGMYSTLNRWRAVVRRLTKHEIQTQTETDSTSCTE